MIKKIRQRETAVDHANSNKSCYQPRTKLSGDEIKNPVPLLRDGVFEPDLFN